MSREDRLSLEEGGFLIRLARKAIEKFVSTLSPPSVPEEYPKALSNKKGVFVTILTYPNEELRGCIGIVYPIKPLVKGVIEAACSAAQDPRFEPLTKEELKKVILEVSVLSEPKEIVVEEPNDFVNKIAIGKDGLLLVYEGYSSVFLPQVPVEQNWNVKEYLENLCLKAGLPFDAWLFYPIKLYKFQAQIFKEVEPEGKVVEVNLSERL